LRAALDATERDAVPDLIAELLATDAAIVKLGARGITTTDARQVLRNPYVVVRNPRQNPPGARRLLIGKTDGGRALTIVIESTLDPSTWLIVTGWDSSPRERKLLPS
jgi:uncharacterized DUF497 family protein